MGQKALSWAYMRTYLTQLRALLRGEQVEVDGALVQMLHGADFASTRPIDVPVVIAANGPKGIAAAHEFGEGIMTIGGGNPDFDWCSALTFGTVLDADEEAGSDRTLAAAGPALTVVYHAMYPDAVMSLPGGPEWRARIDEFPPEARHLAIHEDHLVSVTERDRPLLNGAMLKTFTATGTRAEWRARLDALEGSGVTEILYAPMGPDVPRS